MAKATKRQKAHSTFFTDRYAWLRDDKATETRRETLTRFLETVGKTVYASGIVGSKGFSIGYADRMNRNWLGSNAVLFDPSIVTTDKAGTDDGAKTDVLCGEAVFGSTIQTSLDAGVWHDAAMMTEGDDAKVASIYRASEAAAVDDRIASDAPGLMPYLDARSDFRHDADYDEAIAEAAKTVKPNADVAIEILNRALYDGGRHPIDVPEAYAPVIAECEARLRSAGDSAERIAEAKAVYAYLQDAFKPEAEAQTPPPAACDKAGDDNEDGDSDDSDADGKAGDKTEDKNDDDKNDDDDGDSDGEGDDKADGDKADGDKADPKDSDGDDKSDDDKADGKSDDKSDDAGDDGDKADDKADGDPSDSDGDKADDDKADDGDGGTDGIDVDVELPANPAEKAMRDLVDGNPAPSVPETEDGVIKIAIDEPFDKMADAFAGKWSTHLIRVNANASGLRSSREKTYNAAKTRLSTMIRAIKAKMVFRNDESALWERGMKSGILDDGSLDKLCFGEARPAIFERKEVISRPDVAIGFLIDESGSMNSLGSDGSRERKIDAARDVLIALVEALDGIAGVRTYVWGHSTDDESPYGKTEVVELREYLTPANSRENRPSIAMIENRRNNIDGVAIREAGKRFAEAEPTAAKRFFFVISDGLPHGRFYSGSPAEADVAKGVRQVRSLGVDVYGIGIAKAYSEEKSRLLFGDGKGIVLPDVKSAAPILGAFLARVFGK